MSTIETPVLIVGGGGFGLSMSVFLANNGVDSLPAKVIVVNHAAREPRALLRPRRPAPENDHASRIPPRPLKENWHAVPCTNGLNIPLDAPAALVNETRREKAYSQELQRSGKWRHIWRIAGE